MSPSQILFLKTFAIPSKFPSGSLIIYKTFAKKMSREFSRNIYCGIGINYKCYINEKFFSLRQNLFLVGFCIIEFLFLSQTLKVSSILMTFSKTFSRYRLFSWKKCWKKNVNSFLFISLVLWLLILVSGIQKLK